VLQDLLDLLEAEYGGATDVTFTKDYVTNKEKSRKSYVSVRFVGPASRRPAGVNPHYVQQMVQVDVWGMVGISAAAFQTLWEDIEQILEDNQAGYTKNGNRYATIEFSTEENASRQNNPRYIFQVYLRYFKDTSQ